MDCEVIDGDRRLVSKALMTFAVIPPKQTGQVRRSGGKSGPR